MTKIKVGKNMEKTNVSRKSILFLGLVFVFLFVTLIVPHTTEATGLTEAEKIEATIRLDNLLEKTEILLLLVEAKFQRGELPSSANIKAGEPYIREYIAYGGSNNPEEVRKLQSFLNAYMGESLLVDGFYGSSTFAAVKRFQLKYASEILHPWGIDRPTGFVYLTTQRKINALKYPDRYFPMPTSLTPYSVPVVSYDAKKLPPVIDVSEKAEGAVAVDVGVDGEDVEEDTVIDTKEQQEEETEVTDKQSNIFLWIIVTLSFVGFVAIVLYLFIFSSGSRKKKHTKRKTQTKEDSIDES